MLRQRYGLTVEKYDEMVLEQGGLCLLCLKPPIQKRKHLVVDHSHITGEVRGLLCINCNAGIGMLNEDIYTLKRAIKYLSGTVND